MVELDEEVGLHRAHCTCAMSIPVYIARYQPYIKNLYVPIERITGRVMYAYEPIDREEVLVVIHIV